MSTQTTILKPLHTEKQLDDVLFGKPEQDKRALSEKIIHVRQNLSKISTINGSKVYDVQINDVNLEYNLEKKPDWIKQQAKPIYHYPIEYAHITFTG